MPSLEQDQEYLRAGTRGLEFYLHCIEIYGKLASPSGPSSQLTIAGMLLAAARVRALSRSPSEQQNSMQILEELEATRGKWRAAWERKSEKEIHARFTLWRNFLEDYRGSPADFAGMYPWEVRWRVMLQLLIGEIQEPVPVQAELFSMDEFIRPYFLPGSFIWEHGLEETFQKQPYWFLYGTLKSV